MFVFDFREPLRRRSDSDLTQTFNIIEGQFQLFGDFFGAFFF